MPKKPVKKKSVRSSVSGPLPPAKTASPTSLADVSLTDDRTTVHIPTKKGSPPWKLSGVNMHDFKTLVKAGLTDSQLARALCVDTATVWNWKRQFPQLFNSLKEWKNSADSHVERSLYERATGYECEEVKTQWVSDEDGGRWETVFIMKHYPPDPTAAIFWLKNRKPEEWRDVQRNEISGPNGRAIPVMMIVAEVPMPDAA